MTAIQRLAMCCALGAFSSALFADELQVQRLENGEIERSAAASGRTPVTALGERTLVRIGGARGAVNDCALTDGVNDCSGTFNAESDCFWYPIQQAHLAGTCQDLPDAVDRRLCEYGIFLDGGVIPASVLPGAVRLVDQVQDLSPVSPGETGWEEQPRDVGDPNGLNIGSSGVLYAADTNPVDGVDDSFLLFVLDIADFAFDDSIAPVPYDSDDNGQACLVGPSLPGVLDADIELYAVELQACADLSLFSPVGEDTNVISADRDLAIETFIKGPPLREPLTLSVDPPTFANNVSTFPTATLPGLPPVNPTNGCIDQELSVCSRATGDGNNVQFLIKRIDSSGLIDPDPRITRLALGQMVARLQGRSTGDRGDEEIANIVVQSALPAIEVSKQVRCDDLGNTSYGDAVEALPASTVGFQLVIRNTGNERLDVTVTDTLSCIATPAGNVSATALCGTFVATLNREGATIPVTAGNADSLGFERDFFINVCGDPIDRGLLKAINAGESEPLGAMQGASVERVNGSCVLTEGDILTLEFKAKLNVIDDDEFCQNRVLDDCTNGVAVVGIPIPPQALSVNPAAAWSDVCSIGVECDGSGCYTCDDGLYCNGAEFCAETVPGSGIGACQPGIPPCADGCDEANDTCGFFVQDQANTIDTEEELIAGADDNVVTIDLLCREYDFIKEVGFPGEPGSFRTGTDSLKVPTVRPFPPLDAVQIEFRYSGVNTGEVTEDITIFDAALCDDFDSTAAAFPGEIVAGGCPICTGPVPGQVTLTVAPGASYSTSCIVEFRSQAALEFFLQLDDNRPDCTAADSSGAASPKCHRNCATASAVPNTAALGGICDGGPPIPADSFAEVCNFGCTLEVIKEVRCLPDCTTDPDPGTPWYEEGDPELLAVGGDACLEYRITLTNTTPPDEDVDVCAIEWKDCMSNSGAFDGVPFEVLVSGPSRCPELETGFNWDCVPVACRLVDPGNPAIDRPLQRDEQMVVRFKARVKDPGLLDFALDPVNEITVGGIPENECIEPFFFSCEDISSVGVDLQECDFDLAKDVTCDDPRSPTAVFDPALVDALPGSRVGFRIQITNTGEMPIKQLDITDDLDCPTWYVPGTVIATIGGADVTDCICADGAGCLDITGLSGPKDLTGCAPNALAPGQTLTITFEVKAPADFATMGTAADCTNNVSVTFFNDVCQLTGANPCPTRTDDASINIDVPDIACEKTVCADLNNDGDCADPGEYISTNALRIACDANQQFPIRLIYNVVAENIGEVPFASIEVCDVDLIQHVQNTPGVSFAGCPMSPSGCILLPMPPAVVPPGGVVSTPCGVVFDSQAAWEAFALTDGAPNDCHSNGVTSTGNIDTTGLCSREASTSVDTFCAADVCISPPCVIDIEKSVRCLDNCDDRVPQGVNTNALVVTPGATVEYEYRITNAGVPNDDPGVCMLEITDTRVGAFEYCPTNFCVAELVKPTGPLTCQLPPDCFGTNGEACVLNLPDVCGAELDPGDDLVIRCAGVIPPDAGSGITSNDVIVRGGPDCPAAGDETVYCCTDDDDALIDIRTCGLEVTKDVTCDEPRMLNGDYNAAADWQPDLVDALPGSHLGMAVEICNTGEVPVTQLELNDVPDCDWYVPDSAVATIGPNGADDVTACLCPVGQCQFINQLGNPGDLTACTADGLLPGECLIITFEMLVPDDFNVPGTAVDCTNTVTVEGITDVCRDFLNNPCPPDIDTAGINVLVPDLVCTKEVCADINNDGDCTDPGDYPYTSALQMTCDANDQFPIALDYRVTVNNPGETPYMTVSACDPDLVANAVAAGAVVGPCDFCDDALPPPCDGFGDECAELGPMAVGGSAMATCRLEFPTRDIWLAFAGIDADGDPNCHSNGVETTGEIDTADLCIREAETSVITNCDADVCLSPPCVLDVTKDFRCVSSCSNRTPIGAAGDVLTAAPGATVEFEVEVENIGTDVDPSICVLRFTDTLVGDFVPCPSDFCDFEMATDSGPVSCPVPPDCFRIDGTPCEVNLRDTCGMELEPGDSLVVRCAGTIPAGAADITNDVTVDGAPDCPPAGPVYCCTDDDDASVLIEECGFDLIKDVACGDPRDPAAVFVQDLETFEDTEAGFRFRVINTGTADIPKLQIIDVLTCLTWFVPGSVVATIGGDDVTDCICPAGGCQTIAALNGMKDLTPCPHGPLAPGETLTITFRVNVPDNAAPIGTPVDCTNTVTVEPFIDICVDPAINPCGQKTDDATINVDVPQFDCEKSITADYADDGVIDDGPTDVLVIPDDAPYPVKLTYTFTLVNEGDSDLPDGQVCDQEFMDCVLGVGITVDAASCGLCTGPCDGVDDGCADLGTVPVGGSATVTCDVTVDSVLQFEEWAEACGFENAYVNTAGFSANVATNGVCGEAPVLAPTECEAEWRFFDVPPPCWPLTKANIITWNQNEVKFTGLHRCVMLWEQHPLGMFGIPNNFLRPNLQTEKGKARIDGIASRVCVDDAFDSIEAPLIGIAQRQLSFNGVVRALTGMPLVGMGAEAGGIRYDLHSGSGAERPVDAVPSAAKGRKVDAPSLMQAVAADGDEPMDIETAAAMLPAETPIGQTTQKGSLLAFPSVELRWALVNGQWRLVQDVFIELTNDYPDAVAVQMYFVHGDKPLDAVAGDAGAAGERAHPGCNWVDVGIALTGNEPAYWSAATGAPKGVSPWAVLDAGSPPGRPADDGTGQRVLRGYILAWAVAPVTLPNGRVQMREIAWNHLAGSATVVNYAIGDAWTYSPWAFQALGAPRGAETDGRPGSLRLDGIEYEAAPAMLLFDFYATEGTAFSTAGTVIVNETELTLLPMLQDVRQR